MPAAAALQVALAAIALCTIAFAPPAHGRTLLIPLNGMPVSQALLDRSMLLRVGSGPLPGSVVVEGPGRGLARALFNEGVVMLAAPDVLCSQREDIGGKV